MKYPPALTVLVFAALFGCFSAIAQTESLLEGTWAAFSKTSDHHNISFPAASEKGGHRQIEFHATGENETFSGASLTLPGQCPSQIHFSVEVKRLSELQNCRGQISIEWKGANGMELSRSWGPVWNADNLPEGEPTKFEMTAAAAADAASATLVITLFEDGKAGSGSFRVVEAAME